MECKCEKFNRLSINDIYLHEIYMPYIWLLKLTRTTLVLVGS
jgi:hypothetical protein